MVSLTFKNLKCISKDNEKIFNRAGRPFLSKRFRDFDKIVKALAKSQYKGQPIEGHLKVDLTVWFKNKVHCDTFNLPKGVMDSLQGILFVNDKQIKVGRVSIAENMPTEQFTVDVEVVE
jgi:Holliday junction resolvase RusA-like endonuclease